ncbi:heterokaryon incompatibility protein domain-containing protein [Neurospora intermedia]|uniref:Heterokaryon incompatibility protein domain-containing protein n=1 Tax=Neurospora intermedia TaxID=5142 RepID=A0ABR3CX97_NEUIN
MDNNTSPSSLPPQHQELSYATIPLNTPATKIRLLELFPSVDFSSPLHCRLYNTPISSPAPFKALSYAWGSDDKTHLIYVDSFNVTSDNGNGNGNDVDAGADVSLASGLSAVDISSDDNGVETVDGGRAGADALNGEKCIIRITSSLDTCLRHLRAIHHRDHPSAILTLWIDQLCINQSDSDAKAVQVGLMSHIYSRAKQVLIWLGPAADESDEVMNALAELEREFESIGVSVSDYGRVFKLLKDIYTGVFDEGSGGEKRKAGIGAKEEKNIWKEIKGGIGAREDSGTTCGGDEIVDGCDAAAGNSGEVGCRVDLGGVGVGVANTEALDGAAMICATNKTDSSTGKSAMAVVKDGARKLGRQGLSEELQALFRTPMVYALVGRAGGVPLRRNCLCVCGTRPPVSYDILGLIATCAVYIAREYLLKGGYMTKRDSVSDLDSSFNADVAGYKVYSRDAIGVMGNLGAHSSYLYFNRHRRLKQIEYGEGGKDLFSLLTESYTTSRWSRESKLYRDRAYALLGLAVDADELEIKPDYSNETSTAQILTRVAKAIIRKTKREFPVELLSYSQFPTIILDDSSEQLPSWVPDWRSGLRYPIHYSHTKTDMFMACGPHRSVDMVPTITAGVLGLRGYLVDTIEEVGRTTPQVSTEPQLYESSEFFEKLDKLWMLSKQKNKPIYKTPARREEALWRVPIGDTVRDWQKDVTRKTRAKAGFALEYQKWRRTLEDEKKKATCSTERAFHELGADGGKYPHVAIKEMARRILYLTKDGYMGMGPSNMQPGDVVVVFPGARIPFVLRPTSEDNTFTYVGDAYCDGIMDGEITLREERRDFFLV